MGKAALSSVCSITHLVFPQLRACMPDELRCLWVGQQNPRLCIIQQQTQLVFRIDNFGKLRASHIGGT
eukprot:scaffold10194_cov26-Prasinocladus_malaysianus.AAC.2